MFSILWRNYSEYIDISKKESRISVISGFIGAFIETVSIFYLSQIILELNTNSITENNYLSQNSPIIKFTIIFIIFALFSAYLYFLSNKNIIKAKSKVERYVRDEITDLTLNINWEYYIQLSQGDIAKSIISEGQNISEGYMYFLSAITYISISIVYFFICLILVPDTFFLLIFYGFIAFNIYQFYSKKAAKDGKDLSTISTNIAKSTSAIFNNLKYLRSKGKDKIAKDEAKDIFKNFSSAYIKSMTASYRSKFVTEILSIAFIIVILIYIFINKSNANTLILSLSLFIRLAPKIYNAQTRLLDSVGMISWTTKYKERKKWAEQNKINKPNYKKLSIKDLSWDKGIVFNSVTYKYPDGKLILNNINLTIKDKDFVGIIGKSGVGKSTFIDIIMGLIKPTNGKVLIFGKDLEKINLGLLRENIGIVMQENFFKNDSLISNIALGEKSFNKEKIISALKMANAWDFISSLPNGINEIIYDRGIRFSGGERQRLALARALYNNPRILILDEPSIGLDTLAERKLKDALIKLSGKITIILISHKKSLIKICNNIYLLEDGNLNKQ